MEEVAEHPEERKEKETDQDEEVEAKVETQETETKKEGEAEGVTVSLTHEKQPVDIYYELHGRGPHKLLLIMGLATSCKAWRPNLEYLVQHHADEFEVCIFDNRGVGRSSTPKSSFTSTSMARDAESLLNHLGWERVNVVGISMGGMIALELALILVDQKRLASLALAVTHAGGKAARVPFKGFWTMLTSALKPPEQKARKLMRRLYSSDFLASPAPEGSEEETMYDYVCKEFVTRVTSEPVMSLAGLSGHLRTVSTHYVSVRRLHTLRDSRVPTIVLTGTHDELVRPENSRILGKELEAELIVFEGAGHVINVEVKNEFNDHIVRNIRRGIETQSTEGEKDQSSNGSSTQDVQE